MVAPADFKPDEDVVAALITRVTDLTSSPRNCFAGHRSAYDTVGSPDIPHRAVFATASGGLSSRYMRGYSSNVDERHPIVRIFVRSSSAGVANAFEAGQTLAREVFQAVHLNPPTSDYIDAECLNSQPTYLGRDAEGHHEWLVVLRLIVDVVY